jgi:serine phosphatase RsbU (regulator of sigma subunit)
VTVIVLFAILIVLAFILILYFNSRKQNGIISQQKMIVEEKQKEILDSITYAKRIQAAILPSAESFAKMFPRSFIVYKPKDIVAGDFYWVQRANGRLFVAAADCTGHGVPGAMVSVICNNGLNRSVREYGITEPGKLLDKTREIVLDELSKNHEDVKDGMDISVISFPENLSGEEINIQWSGANNPLWIVRNGTIVEIDPDKQPIGKYDHPKPFSNHHAKLVRGDFIYIFTDGFQDQFGGDKGKKLKARNLKQLLLSIYTEKPEVQKNKLEEFFEKWKGALEQIDDVCLIGVGV